MSASQAIKRNISIIEWQTQNPKEPISLHKLIKPSEVADSETVFTSEEVNQSNTTQRKQLSLKLFPE